jgi:2TM family of unknown function (DUF5676)
MSQMQSAFAPRAGSGERAASSLSIVTLGFSLSVFFAISYMVCIAGYLLLPGLPVEHAALSIFLPGFELLSWRSFFLGLVETVLWGWYIAVVFGPLYNFFGRRAAR